MSSMGLRHQIPASEPAHQRHVAISAADLVLSNTWPLAYSVSDPAKIHNQVGILNVWASVVLRKYWIGQCSLHRPTATQPSGKNADIYSMSSGNLRKWLSNAFKCHKSSASSVGGLFRGRGPATVIRRVRTIVVHSFYRVPWRWSAAQIGKKALKGLQPPIADCYASSTVFSERFLTLVVATVSNRSPDSVLWALTHLVGGRSCGGSLLLKAPTGLSRTAFKVVQPEMFLSSAVASAQRISECASMPTRQDRQASELIWHEDSESIWCGAR